MGLEGVELMVSSTQHAAKPPGSDDDDTHKREVRRAIGHPGWVLSGGEVTHARLFMG